MTALRRWAAVPLIPLLALALALVAAGCGPSAPGTPPPSGGADPSAAASPALTAVPGGLPSPVIGATVGPPTTTDTEFGEIWDGLPPSFPKVPGQQPAETGAAATSGTFAVPNTTVAAASQTIADALRAQGWSVEVGSPLEDGSVVIDAGGAREGCVVEVRFTPRSGTVVMSVLYGASCPFG